MSSKPSLPLRTAIIGLSSSAVTSWAATAHLPSLLHPHGRQLFNITALCNSSVSAAQAAIKAFDLPPETKAYGSPADLAADPEIDVVICNTRVDKHFETVVDSVKAGKKVYVEWPVTSSVADTEQLVRLAAESGSVVAVGLQGRLAPPLASVRKVLESGRLGRVLSSDVRAFGATVTRDMLPAGLKYFGEKSVGGNMMTIGFGHLIDWQQSVLGELVEGTTTAKTQIQKPENKIFDPKTKEMVGSFTSDVPDLIVINGSLTASDFVAKDATLSLRFRRGPPFKDEPALVWSVYCEQGEIRLISPMGVFLQSDAYGEPVRTQIHHFGDDSIEDIDWNWSSEQEAVPIRARNVMKALYAFAEGAETGWASLQSAAIRAKQIDSWVEQGRW